MTLTTSHDANVTPPTGPDVQHRPGHSTRVVVGWAAIVAAVAATGALAVTVFTDSEPSTPARTRSVSLDDVRGSDRHLELRAAEVAGRTEAQRSAAGSDRHLELRAAEIAKGQRIAP